MKYLITVEVPSDASVETALVIQQMLDALKVLPRDFNAMVEQIQVENPPVDPPVEEPTPE